MFAVTTQKRYPISKDSSIIMEQLLLTDKQSKQELAQPKLYYETVYGHSYKTRCSIKPGKPYEEVIHGIGKPFFTTVPSKLQDDFLPLSPSNTGHRLANPTLWNQPFLPNAESTNISETHDNIRSPPSISEKLKAIAFSLATNTNDSIELKAQLKPESKPSGYNRGIFPIFGSMLRADIEDSRFQSKNQIDMIPPKNLALSSNKPQPGTLQYQAERIGINGFMKNAARISFFGNNEWQGNLPPVRLTKSLPAQKTFIIGPEEKVTLNIGAAIESSPAKLSAIPSSRISAADYWKNINSPVYPGHCFMKSLESPVPGIAGKDQRSNIISIKPHPSAIKPVTVKQNVRVKEIANEGGFAVRGNSLPPLYSNIGDSKTDHRVRVEEPSVSEATDSFAWRGWVTDAGNSK